MDQSSPSVPNDKLRDIIFLYHEQVTFAFNILFQKKK